MRSTPSTEIVLRSVCPRATLFKGIPSSSTNTCAGEEPRMLGCASSPSPPYARTDTSATVRTASATVRAPDRWISSREITVTEAGVDVAGWGRFPGTMTSGSSNVGGCTGTGSGVCAITVGTGKTTSITVTIPVNKKTQRPTRPLGPWWSIPPTSSAAKACGAAPCRMVRGAECGQVFWLPDHCPSPAFPSAPLRFSGGAQWRTMEKDFPVTAARPRRSYTGLPFTLTLGAVFHGLGMLSFRSELARSGASWRVGELKSWKVKEAAVSLQLSNSPTFQLSHFQCLAHSEADGQRADRIHVPRGDHLDEYLSPG